MKRNVLAGIGLLAAWFGCGQTGFAQLSLPSQQPIVGARMPALSPDGKQLAFVYRGDIWITSDKGGRATPLTQHVETDAYPLFSPDGHWVAFASKRNGNWDIFAVPAEGGKVRHSRFLRAREVDGSPTSRRAPASSSRR